MKSTITLLCVYWVFFLSSCSSPKESKSSTPPAAATGNTQTGVINAPCSIPKQLGKPVYTSNLRVDLNQPILSKSYSASAPVSLCQLLATARTPIVTMQFSGAYCATCQEQVRQVAQVRNSGPLAGKFTHYVVFLDSNSSDGFVQQSQFDSFVNGTAQMAFDPNKQFFQQVLGLSINPIQYGAGIAFNAYGDVFFMPNSEGPNFNTFFGEVQNILATM